MSFIQTPNMNLPVPVVGQEDGPQYGIDINSCFSLLDQHDHTPGKGVAITPSGINVNAALSMADNFLTNAAGINFQAQGSTPSLNTMYVSGVDYYLVDGSGNNIRLTQSGGIAGAPGSISGLVSPASATYVPGLSTFVWQSGVNIAANMDVGALLMRNLSPNSTFALTLQPPAALGSNYTITLPALPGASSFLSIDSSGTITATPSLTQGILTSMIADLNVTAAKIANLTITGGKVALATLTGANLTANAGILPSQIDSLSSAVYIKNSASTSSFSTSSGSLVTCVAQTTALSLVTTRPTFIQFATDGNGTTPASIVVSGGTATFALQIMAGLVVVDTPNFINLGPGTYPPSVLNFIYPSQEGSTGNAGSSVRVQVKMSAGSVQLNSIQMSLIQV